MATKKKKTANDFSLDEWFRLFKESRETIHQNRMEEAEEYAKFTDLEIAEYNLAKMVSYSGSPFDSTGIPKKVTPTSIKLQRDIQLWAHVVELLVKEKKEKG